MRQRNDAPRLPRDHGLTVAKTRMNTPTCDTTMAELLARWPAARSVVGQLGMACVGCAMARFETIAEAAVAYGFDTATFMSEVSAARPRPHAVRRSRTRGAARPARRPITRPAP